MRHINDIVIENARIIFPNFSGAKGKFNPAGNRNFNVVLDPDRADRLIRDGWNVKMLAPKQEGDYPLQLLPVSVSYKSYPPKIVLINSKGKAIVDEDDLAIFDFAEFTNIDLIINPYFYDFDGHTGIKAYLKAMYATIYEDELEKKYLDVPDSALSGITGNYN